LVGSDNPVLRAIANALGAWVTRRRQLFTMRPVYPGKPYNQALMGGEEIYLIVSRFRVLTKGCITVG
jgi:hypothetical protein